jgi:hypothetical protein
MGHTPVVTLLYVLQGPEAQIDCPVLHELLPRLRLHPLLPRSMFLLLLMKDPART